MARQKQEDFKIDENATPVIELKPDTSIPDPEIIEVPIVKAPYKINPKLAEQGYAANCKKYNGNIYVVSQQTYKAGIDPVTGTNSARVIEHKSTLYINGTPQDKYEIPGDTDERVIWTLAQANAILLSDEQAKEYRELIKKVHRGEVKF